MSARIEANGVAVEFEDIGEGVSGEYDETNPDDRPLLRFYVQRLLHDGEWEDVDDASYCTNVHAGTDPDVVAGLALLILVRVADAVRAGDSIKKVCEELSWMDASWAVRLMTAC